VRPVRLLYLYIKVYVLPTHTVYNFFLFRRYLTKKKVHLKTILKSHIFIFYSAPCQIFFIFTAKFEF